MTPQVAHISGNRLHVQHGPIDLIIGAEGARSSVCAERNRRNVATERSLRNVSADRDRDTAFAAAADRAGSILSELMAEYDLLHAPVTTDHRPEGHIARKMHAASLLHADGRTTPMICVAGAVAEAVLAAMVARADLTRAYVNNGGDIALHLTGDARFDVGLSGPEGQALGRLRLTATDPVRGVATSGQRGRSLSLGIADSVTVLARSAAMADAAATQIANAVDLPDHPAITRVPAQHIRDGSDLGAAPVVRHVGGLRRAEVAMALDRGLACAMRLRAGGLIDTCALFLRGQSRILGTEGLTLAPMPTLQPVKDMQHA